MSDSPPIQDEIDRLAAPAEDGGVLIWPDPSRLPHLIERNRRLRQGFLASLIARMTGRLRPTPTLGAPLILTGHQPEFLHPGVWIKHVAAVRLARQLGGRAEFWVVDHDAAGPLALEWPVVRENRLQSVRLPVFAGVGGRSFEQLGPWAMGDCQSFFGKIPPDIRRSETAMGAFEAGCASAQPSNGRSEPDYVDRWMTGVAGIDAAAGTESPGFRRVGGEFSHARAESGISPRQFVAWLLLNAGEFAAAYNSALAAYRDQRRIRGHRHPIPDLEIERDRVELPLWIRRLTSPRARLWVSIESRDRVQLFAGAESARAFDRSSLASDPDAALSDAASEWRIRPRALTLTLFVRLFACDLFIHGVGGAKYDQITDEIIRRFFNVEPPAYACISATLHLPLTRHGVTPDTLRSHRRLRRDVFHNPLRHCDECRPASGEPEWTAAIEEWDTAIKRSEALRRSEADNHARRRETYHRIRAALQRIAALNGGLIDRLERENDSLVAAQEHDRVANRRDWFVGLYPTGKIRDLAHSLSFR